MRLLGIRSDKSGQESTCIARKFSYLCTELLLLMVEIYFEERMTVLLRNMQELILLNIAISIGLWTCGISGHTQFVKHLVLIFLRSVRDILIRSQ